MNPRFKTARAIAALVMGFGFFVGTIGLVVGLVYAGISVGQFVGKYARGTAMLFGGGLVIGLFLVAAVVGWSLFPRRRAFKPPGPELKRELHPALFKEIDRVAARCGVTGPKHVYLAPDVNAFVADVGGIVGIGSTRVLALGLPLLHCLTLAELRSVLAHEFGHYAGGDTRIGGLVYRVRIAVQEIVESLDGASNVSASSDFAAFALLFGAVRYPFLRFGHFYVRFTFALSRAQELAADALAAQLEGVEVLTRSLKKIRGASVAFDKFMQGEVIPLLQQGYLPPIGPGLSRFLDTPAVVQQLERHFARLEEDTEEAFDSHPPLSVRVTHAKGLGLRPPRQNSTVEGLAFELLTHRPELEMMMVDRWVKGAPLKRVTWEDAGPIFERAYRHQAAIVAPSLEGQTPATLPRERNAVLALLGNLPQPMDDEELRYVASVTWLPVIITLLLDAGFSVQSELGKPLTLMRGDEVYEPVLLLHGYLFDGEEGPWMAMWNSVGLAQAELGLVGQTTVTE